MMPVTLAKTGPNIMDVPTHRVATQNIFTTHDGNELFYRHWPAIGLPILGTVYLFQHCPGLTSVV
jgi:hypothetical protein